VDAMVEIGAILTGTGALDPSVAGLGLDWMSVGREEVLEFCRPRFNLRLKRPFHCLRCSEKGITAGVYELPESWAGDPQRAGEQSQDKRILINRMLSAT
jgi:hypothetical protein